jgi:tRNA pseudouridine65 synthase
VQNAKAFRPKIIETHTDWVVVDKPPGWAVYGDKPSLQDWVMDQLGGLRVFPVHRLDKDTTGVLLFARSPSIAAHFTESFRKRRMLKTYQAWVWGVPEKMAASITFPLKKKSNSPEQSARTDYRVLKTTILTSKSGESHEFSLLELEPKTGRYHQIRRHLKMLGHPIVADPEYCPKIKNAWTASIFPNLTICLCAVSLRWIQNNGNQKTWRVKPRFRIR